MSTIFFQVSCPWPTQDPTPTARNSSCAPSRPTGEYDNGLVVFLDHHCKGLFTPSESEKD